MKKIILNGLLTVSLASIIFHFVLIRNQTDSVHISLSQSIIVKPNIDPIEA